MCHKASDHSTLTLIFENALSYTQGCCLNCTSNSESSPDDLGFEIFKSRTTLVLHSGQNTFFPSRNCEYRSTPRPFIRHCECWLAVTGLGFVYMGLEGSDRWRHPLHCLDIRASHDSYLPPSVTHYGLLYTKSTWISGFVHSISSLCFPVASALKLSTPEYPSAFTRCRMLSFVHSIESIGPPPTPITQS